MLNFIKNNIEKNPLKWLLIYSLAVRLLVLFFYDGYTIVNDSQDYIDLSQWLSTFNLNGYTGERTPGFPLIIALMGGNLQWVIYFQLLLGLFNVYLIFDITKISTNNNLTAFVVAFLCTSFLHFVYYEMAIMTETLSLSLITLLFWFILKFDVFNPNCSWLKLFVLSFLCVFLYFTRPFFIYLPMLLTLFFIFKNFNNNYRSILVKISFILVLPIISFYSWSKLNEKNIGIFGSTYYLGYNLSQTATPFFEKADDNDAVIRDVLVKHRDSILIHNPTQLPMSVWYAYDELLEKTKLTPQELSLELSRISKNLFKNHPVLYLKQVFISWMDFWFEKLMWNPEKITSTVVRKGLIGLWIIIQQYLGLIINLLFLVFSIKKIWISLKNKFRTFDFELLIITTVLAGSIAQALVAYGSNARFSFPFFALIVYFVIINLKRTIQHYVRST